MIHPNKTKFHFWLITLYAKWTIKRNFSNVRFLGEFKNEGKALLVIGNHSTWWDGFWMLLLNDVILKKKFYILMLERELRKRPFFSKVGAYSINPMSFTIKKSLKFTHELLQIPDNLVVFYPEGKFSPTGQMQKEFQRGIEILYRENVSFNTLFVASITDYFAQSKPILSIYFEQINVPAGTSKEQLEKEYNEFFVRCIDQQKQIAL